MRQLVSRRESVYRHLCGLPLLFPEHEKPLLQILSLLQLLGDCHDLIYNVAELH